MFSWNCGWERELANIIVTGSNAGLIITSLNRARGKTMHACKLVSSVWCDRIPARGKETEVKWNGFFKKTTASNQIGPKGMNGPLTTNCFGNLKKER